MKHKYNIQKFILAFLLTVIYSNIISQTSQWKWAKSAIGDDFDQASAIAADSKGNVYVAGSFSSDSIIFDGIKLYNSGISFSDVFLAKYDSSGTLQWAKSSGGSIDDRVNSLTIDKNDNIYLAGNFYSPAIIFGTFTLVNAGVVGDIFIVKYDESGNVIWAKRDGGPGLEIPYGITTDISGNVIVAGRFSSLSVTFGTTTLTQQGSMDVFVVKYDSQGNVKWAKGAGGTSNDEAYAIITDDKKNIIVAGYFNQNATFETTTLTTSGVADIFLAKYDSTGLLLWVKKTGGNNSEIINDISLDANSNIYAVGYFSSTSVNFGSTTLNNNYSEGVENAFIAKYNKEGNPVWAHGLNGRSEALSIEVNKNKVYTCGTFNDDSLNYGNSKLELKGNSDFFLLQTDTAGNSKHAFYQSDGGESPELANALITDMYNNVYVAGNFRSDMISFGNSTLIASRGFDMFVAKMGTTQTGINLKNKQEAELNIYPNPNTGQIFLNTDESITNIEIYNPNGIKVFERKYFKNKIVIDVINLQTPMKGVYYMHIYANDYKITKKIIVF